MNEVVIHSLVDRYLTIISVVGEPNELYKYDAINYFQENWNLEDPNFAEMIKTSFSRAGNLLYQNSWDFIYKTAKEFPEEVREMFDSLYDERLPIDSRILNFQIASDQILVKMRQVLQKENFNAQQDEKTLSAYLSFRYPEKYSLYKYSFFKRFSKEFKINNSTSQNGFLLTYYSLLPVFRKVISERADFAKIYRSYYKQPQWDDMNLMIQNILFVNYRSDLTGLYNDVLQPFSKGNLIAYFNYLDQLIIEHGIIQGTQKCVFSCSDKQINFIVGQKYVWSLKSSTHGETFKVIGEGMFGIHSEKFQSSENSFLNHITDTKLLEKHKKGIDRAIVEVFNKTIRSGYLKNNDGFIERLAFDKDFRSKVIGGEFSPYSNKGENYWLFQGNPDYYDVVSALTDSSITSWKVAAHKDKIKVGDKIILWFSGNNSGVYGLGEVTSSVGKNPIKEEELKYYKSAYDPNEDRVDIIITHNFAKNPVLSKIIRENNKLNSLKGGNQGTNFSATREQYEELIRISNLQTTTMNYPLNQILFGCPGSGKTYSTKKLAVEIIEDRMFGNTKDDRDEILRLYDHYSNGNQIRFTTFHQSMGYEDFIEGIKPKTVDNKVLYEVEDGIFTKIASKAQDNWLNAQSARQNSIPFEDALLRLKSEWEEDNSIKFPLKTQGSDFTIISFNEKNLRFRKSSGGTGHTLSFKTMKELFYGERVYSHQGLGIYYPSIIDKLISYTNDSSSSKSLDRFVLIMDEINRGNISSIFGELITLIEDDKRLGSRESIEVTLPYSKEGFGVPPNLYLLGTMNTADRSVESLDTALRRRFSFTEMKSDPQVLVYGHEYSGKIPNTNIDLIVLLETINKRIELLVDKDHQIGHSYFIGVNTVEELKRTFKNKIIPLLEEYFYGDFGKIGLVLGDRFVFSSSTQDNKKILAKFKGYDDVEFLTEKKIYTFADVDTLSVSDFISIYQDNAE